MHFLILMYCDAVLCRAAVMRAYMLLQVCYMMLIQDEKEEEALVLVEMNKPHPGLHGLLKKDSLQGEGDSLLGGTNFSDEEEEEKEDFADEMTL